MAAKNANDALGLLKVIENATNDITNMLQRIRELMVKAGGLVEDNPSDRDHKNLQSVADTLITEITRISSTATYNSKALLGADTSSINIQVGYNGGDQIAFKTYSGSASSLGLRSASILAEKNSGLIIRQLALPLLQAMTQHNNWAQVLLPILQ